MRDSLLVLITANFSHEGSLKRSRSLLQAVEVTAIRAEQLSCFIALESQPAAFKIMSSHSLSFMMAVNSHRQRALG